MIKHGWVCPESANLNGNVGMSLLADLLTTLSDTRNVSFPWSGRTDIPLETLCEDLLSSRGEVSGSALAQHILERYAALDEQGRLDFFRFLVVGLDIDETAVRSALESYEEDRSRNTYRKLMAVAEPRRQEVIRRLNQVPDATGRLVSMRKDLLAMMRTAPELGVLDLDFQHLFASWFNRGFLVLRPVNWESPAHVLEKIILYEAVHAIGSWRDLRRRLQPSDRRCFAYFHPAMPDEPLIFVEVALTQGIPSSIQDVLAEERQVISADSADTAVFYSISNCQAGLAGISFGNSLIKQVVEDLSRELAQLKTFVTLSPIPTLMGWLKETEKTDLIESPESLRAVAAQYLSEIKNDRDMPKDPVARFHLTNGALLHDVHAEADVSENGMAQSGGAMVNYLYDRSKISQNHEAFMSSQKVPASPKVRGLVKTALRSEQQGAN